MANKKLRFVALIVVALALVCMLVACTTTTTKASYNVIIHLGDGQSDITWDRQADFPTLSREHYTEEGLYLDAEFKTATTREDLKAMWLTSDIDVYVNWTKIIYKITVHPANGEQDVIWEPAPGNKIPAFTKVGYIMDGFYFDENCTQSADSVFAEELLEHKEVWVKWVECDHKAVTEWTTDKNATCTEDGHKIATCPTCAKELEDTITALGHNSDGKVDHKDADCINDGVVGGSYCTRCGLGKEAAEKVIPALGHKYGEVSYVWSEGNKTCTASRTCANDASHVETETVTVTATVVQNKTCTLDELTTYVATFENSAFATQTKANIKTADKTGHNYGEVSYVWSEDNKKCTATRSCTNADCTHAETETVETKATVTQHSSCTTVELTTYVATFENSAFAEQKNENVQTANAGEHNYTEFVKYTKEPTCTEGGKAIYKCGGCSDTKEIDVDALGHNSDGKVEHKDADCISAGVVGGSYCTRCNDGKAAAEATIDALGHNSEGAIDHKDANCTETGVVGGSYCTRCNEGKTAAETIIPINSENHTYGDLIDKVPESCTTDGKAAHYHCACGQYFNESKEAVEESALTIKAHHSYGDTSIVWNDDHTAFVATRTCANCTDDVVGHTQTATSTEHSVYAIATQPTCTEAGTADYIVTFNADWIEGEQTVSAWYPAKGHSYTKQVATQDYLVSNATCTAKAVYYYSCECGAKGTETFEYGELGSHNYGEWIKKVDPSCLEEGTLGHYHCSVCEKNFDAEYAELNSLTIDKADHTTQHTEKVDATCSEDGNIEYWYCTGCETYFSDEACTTQIEQKDTVISATGKHAYTFVTENSATASEAGTKAHYHCDGCGKDFDLNKDATDDLVIEAGTTATYTVAISIENYAKDNNWLDKGAKQYKEIEHDCFKIELSGSTNSGKYYFSNNEHQWRLYKSDGGKFEVTASEKYGCTLSAITLIFSGDSEKLTLNGEALTTGKSTAINADSATVIAANGKAYIKVIEIEFGFKSAEEIAAEELAKAQEAVNDLKLDEMKTAYSATGTYDSLPTTNKNGATVTWSVVENDYCSITEDGKLSIDKIENQTITLSVAVKVGGQTVNKTVDITISAETLQYKLTISEDKTYILIEVNGAAGTISGGTLVDEGTELTITVTNNDSENYAITKVLAGTTELTQNENGTYSFTMTEATTISVETKEILNTPQKIVDALYALESGKSLEGTYELTGKVISIDTAYNSGYGNITVTIANIEGVSKADKTVKCYRLTGDNADILMVNDIITVSGTLMNFGGTKEFAEACTIKAYTKGTSKISVTAENATVTFDDEEIAKNMYVQNGTTFTFSVAATTGYTITTVKVNNSDATATNDKYSVTVNSGDVTITVKATDPNGAQAKVVATFEFGDNGAASHKDGSSATAYSETSDNYTLTLSSLTKVSSGAFDATGNSCLKLGTNSAVGSFSFTASDDVKTVKIYVAKYKTNTTKIKVNDTSYTLSKNSNSGEYDVIEVDVSENKTISFTTVSGGVRCMIDKIEFYA